MRIVYVTDVVYPYVKGGAEKRIHELSRRMASMGHEVHVFSVKWWEGPEVFKEYGVTYHGVCRKRDLYVGGRRSIAEAIWFSLHLLGPLSKERFDVIDCNQHPYFSTITCKAVSLISGSRLYVTWHELWGSYWYEYLGIMGVFGRIVEKITLMLPEKIIAVSQRTADDLTGDGIRPEKIKMVSNGIPYERIRQTSPAKETCDVVYAGRLISDKNVDVLLRACALLLVSREIRLAIFGEGPEKASLERLARELKIDGHAEFGGFLAEEELMARMKSAKLFVLPSTREGFSITTLEALACGLPVITVNGLKNHAKGLLEDGKTGLIVDLDEKAMSDAITGLLSDDDRRKAMSAACVAAASRYDWDRLVDELEQVYRG